MIPKRTQIRPWTPIWYDFVPRAPHLIRILPDNVLLKKHGTRILSLFYLWMENKCITFLPGPPGTPSWTHCESHCFQAAHCRGKVVKCVCCDFYQQVISVRLCLTLSSCFHTCIIFWHVRRTKTQPSCSLAASGSLYQSGPNSRLFASVLMYSICLESCTSPLLLCRGALNPTGTAQGSSRHMVKTGETRRRLPGCEPPIPRCTEAYCLQTDSVAVAVAPTRSEERGRLSALSFYNFTIFSTSSHFQLKKPWEVSALNATYSDATRDRELTGLKCAYAATS